MPTNNFKLFDEKKANMMTDEEYAINQQRLNGVQSGVASSQLQNKTLYQTALMCYALAQLMAANGYDANDADAVSTFVNNLSSTMVQKVKDRASEIEVKDGKDIAKYISPDIFKKFYSKIETIKGTGAPTNKTKGELGQTYIDEQSQRTYICVNINGGNYTWQMLGYIKPFLYTEIIDSSKVWNVPSGVTSVMVRCFGAGGNGDKNSGGGGGGYMKYSVIDVSNVKNVNITIGAPGTGYGGAGLATSFGSFLTAQGGGGGSRKGGGDGGSGGGGGEYGGNGGNAQYGGGGGGGEVKESSGVVSAGNGGNGGEYGGGGGGGAMQKSVGFVIAGSGGSGGTYGGNGGNGGNKGVFTLGEDGTNTIGMDLEFTGEGRKGGVVDKDATWSAGGGGGGYGGNGGVGESYRRTGTQLSGGGGGGYGGNGGNAKGLIGGGGGGYGGNANGAGGGGYGANNYGCGGSIGSDDYLGKSGVVIVQYYKFELV